DVGVPRLAPDPVAPLGLQRGIVRERAARRQRELAEDGERALELLHPRQLEPVGEVPPHEERDHAGEAEPEVSLGDDPLRAEPQDAAPGVHARRARVPARDYFFTTGGTPSSAFAS